MKKKKLTINKLALGNLKQRRKQYIILIIGIILAMVFSSSTLFFLFSSNETHRAKQFDRLGKQQEIMAAYDDDGSLYSKLLEEGRITDYGLAHVIGYGYMNEENRNFGTAIAWLDDKCKEISNQSFIEGSYPQNENEIAIEESALFKLGINAKIGDEITLNVDIQDGGLNYFGTIEKTYKLVGIVKDKRQNLAYQGQDAVFLPAAFVAQGTQTEIGGRELITAYLSLPDMSFEENFAYSLYVNELTGGYAYSENYNAYWEDDFFGGITSNGGYIAVIAIVLIFVSCIAIVNAFNTNLKERKKQIGMLRAVGATRRQIIKIFGREAFIITLICTPISLAISYGIVRIAITLMNEEAVMTSSFSVLLISAAVCVIVTMLSAMIPLLSASRVTPMQAIRNIAINRKMNTKKIKSKTQFDVPAHLAKRNTQFYKGGKIAVSVILIATIIFSCVAFSYISYEMENAYYTDLWDYEIYGMGKNHDYLDYVNSEFKGMSEADKREIEDYPYFSKVISEKHLYAILEVDEISDYFRCFWDIRERLELIDDKDNSENIGGYVDSFSRGKDILPVPVYSYDQSTIEALEDSLTAGEIDYDKLATGEEIILVAPSSAKYGEYPEDHILSSETCYDGETVPEIVNMIYEGEIPYSVGDKISLSVLEVNGRGKDEFDQNGYDRTDREVTIGAIVSPRKLGYDLDRTVDYDFAFLTIHSGMSVFCEKAKYESLYMSVDSDTEVNGEIDDMITGYMNSFCDKYGGWITSAYARNLEAKETMNFMLVVMISIVLIAFVVCAAIINNSLTASIREKKKEIGTLRAVGADIGVLVKSYIRQLLSMLGLGYGVGFAAFIIIYVLMVIKYNIQDKSYEFIFSPWETLAFCLVLFVICSINLWSKIRKEMKNSIVDNIREL